MTPRAVEVVRVARRQQAAGGAIHIGRDIEAAGQCDRLLVAASHPDLGAQQHRRPLGPHQDVGQSLDVGRIADRLGRGAVSAFARDDRRFAWDLAVENVARDLEIGGAIGAGEAFARRHRDHVGDPLGAAHPGGELGDRRHHVDVRQVLQRAHLVLGQRALAADVKHRAFRAKGRGDAGDRIGAAGPGGGDHAAELAGLARIAVGGVGGDLLVADVDDADPLVEAAIVDVDDVSAAQREDRVHALVLQRLGDQMSARDDLSGAVLPDQGIARSITHGVRLPHSMVSRPR